jgi:hypothetical protein
MKKSNYVINATLILSMYISGCGTKEFHHYLYVPNQKNDHQGNSSDLDRVVINSKEIKNIQKNKIKSMLFSEIVTDRLSIEKKNEFLASSLLYLIKGDLKKNFQLKTNYLEEIVSIDEIKLMVDAGKILDHNVKQAVDASERYKQFLEHQSIFLNKKQFNSFEVAKLIERTRNTVESNGIEAAEKLLNSQLVQWSSGISELIFDLALENELMRNGLERVIGDVQNGMLVIPKLDSSFTEISKVLPEITEVQKVVKAQFSKIENIGSNKIEFEKAIKSALLKDVQKTSEDIKNIIKNKSGFDNAKNIFDRVDSALDLAALAYQTVFGPSKDIQKVVNIARSVVVVTKAVNSINFGKIGANLATGNVIGAVNDIVGSLFGFSSGIDPETKQMLQNIQQDIAEFRNHVDKRFDEVITKLDQQLKLLQQIDVKLDKVQFVLAELTESVSQISQKIDQGFDSIFENEFKSHYVMCFKSSLNVPGDLGHIRDCLDYFFHYAANASLIPQKTGFFSVEGGSPLGEINSRLTEFGSLNKFGFLDVAMGLVFDRFDSSGNPKIHLDLMRVNISDFIIGTEAYLSLVKSNSDMLCATDALIVAENVELLKSMAKGIQASLLRLSSHDFLSEKTDEYYTSAESLSDSSDIKKDLRILVTKYKLLINLMKIADPFNVYKLPEFEELFVLNGFSKLHVDLMDYTKGRNGDEIDPAMVFNVRNRLNKEAVSMNSYLRKRYQESNSKGLVSTLIDPVLEHIEMVADGMRPVFDE